VQEEGVCCQAFNEKMQEDEAKKESEGEKVEVTAPLVPPTLPSVAAQPPIAQTTTSTAANTTSFAVASHTQKQSSAGLEDSCVPYVSKR